MLTLYLSLFPSSNFNEVLFYMLGINCIKLLFGYLYFSPNTFPKIKLGVQLEIHLSICALSFLIVFSFRNYYSWKLQLQILNKYLGRFDTTRRSISRIYSEEKWNVFKVCKSINPCVYFSVPGKRRSRGWFPRRCAREFVSELSNGEQARETPVEEKKKQ